MNNNKHRVSIGMPVYNGENFIKEAIDSILAQTFKDFELIISDNASTDGTAEICRAYATKEQRIRYYRNEHNLGAAKNYNRVFELSSGEYFRWAAHDDVLAPELIERCVEVLDQDLSVVLCYSKAGKIDQNSALVGIYDDSEMKVDSQKPHERFHDLISIPHICISIFGLIRASALNTTPLIASYVTSDRILLGELSLMGRFYILPEQLFCRRYHPQALSSGAYPRLQTRLGWFDSQKAGRINFPTWRSGIEYFKAVTRASLSWSERLLCYAQMGAWLKRQWSGLFKDLVIAVIQPFLLTSRAGRRVLAAVKFVLRHSSMGRKVMAGFYEQW